MLDKSDNNRPFGQLLVTAREAATMLCISLRTLWQLTADGVLRAVRIGRAVRYDVADLRAFIERQKGQ